MQTDRSTNRQTKNHQGAGSANSGAYYIPVLKPDAASRPAAWIAWPTTSLPLCPRNYGRGLVIFAWNLFKSFYTKFERKYANLCKLAKKNYANL